MGMLKNYLNDLVCAAGVDQNGQPNSFAQDAVQFAIDMGLVRVTGNSLDDLAAIISQSDALCRHYAAELARNEALQQTLLAPLYQQLAA